MKYGIYELAGATGLNLANHYYGNHFFGIDTPISTSASYTRVRHDNWSNPTITAGGDRALEAGSGTATVANVMTSIAVTHGLDSTPAIKDISVTPTNSLGSAAKFWVSTPTSTQFTINTNADPGATTATFAWKATIQ